MYLSEGGGAAVISALLFRPAINPYRKAETAVSIGMVTACYCPHPDRARAVNGFSLIEAEGFEKLLIII